MKLIAAASCVVLMPLYFVSVAFGDGADGGAAGTESAASPSKEATTGEGGDAGGPRDVAEALALKARGVSWTNREVRAFYRALAGQVPARDLRWRAEGLSAEARARRAYEHRRNARLTARAMMKSRRAVRALERRDLVKYGNKDGPTFEFLVESAKKKGLTGDAVFEAIVAGARRTNQRVDRSVEKKGEVGTEGAPTQTLSAAPDGGA